MILRLTAANSDPIDITFYDHHLWVLNVSNRKVYCYTLAGHYVAAKDWLLRPTNTQPRGIAFFRDMFWIPDVSKTVHAYNKDGTFPPPDSFPLHAENGTATGVTFVSDDSVIDTFNNKFYVIDSSVADIFVYDQNGVYIRKYGNEAGLGALLYSSISHRVVNGNPHFYLPSTSNNTRLVHLVLNNNFTTSLRFVFYGFTIVGTVGSVVVGSKLYILSNSDRKIYAFQINEGSPTSITYLPDEDFDLSPANSSPTGLTWGQEKFWITDNEDDEVYTYSITGEHSVNEEFDLQHTNGQAQGLVFEGNRLFVVDFTTDRLHTYNLDGSRPSLDFTTPSVPNDIVIMGNKFAILHITENKLSTWTPDREFVKDIALPVQNNQFLGIKRIVGPHVLLDDRPYLISLDRISINEDVMDFTRQEGLIAEQLSKFGVYTQEKDEASVYVPPNSNNGDVRVASLKTVNIINPANISKAIAQALRDPSVANIIAGRTATEIEAEIEKIDNKIDSSIQNDDANTNKIVESLNIIELGTEGALTLSGVRDEDHDIVAGEVDTPQDIAYEAGTFWIFEDGDRTGYAYSGVAAVPNQNLTLTFGNAAVRGATIFAHKLAIADNNGKIYIYQLDGIVGNVDAVVPIEHNLQAANNTPLALTHYRDRLYCVDGGAVKRIYVYHDNGVAIPFAGFDLDLLNADPRAVTAFAGHLFVADGAAHKIFAYRLNGLRTPGLDFVFPADFAVRGIIFEGAHLWALLDRVAPLAALITSYAISIVAQSAGNAPPIDYSLVANRDDQIAIKAKTDNLPVNTATELTAIKTMTDLAEQIGSGIANRVRLDIENLYNSIYPTISNTLKYFTNRKRVSLTANTKTVYDDDGVTPIKVFDLKDAAGNPNADASLDEDPQ